MSLLKKLSFLCIATGLTMFTFSSCEEKATEASGDAATEQPAADAAPPAADAAPPAGESSAAPPAADGSDSGKVEFKETQGLPVKPTTATN